jgi:hypothetical protein
MIDRVAPPAGYNTIRTVNALRHGLFNPTEFILDQ